MKSRKMFRLLSTVRSLLYLSILVALAWYLIENYEAREAIGTFGLTLTWIVILFGAALIIVRWRQQQRSPMIYPFLNATGDRENKEKYDALALNFSELLQLEIQRIRHLLYIPESIEVNNPAFKEKLVPRPIITPAGPATLRSARVEVELGEMLKGIGAISFGSVSLPLGGLLYLLAQTLQGGGITGKIQKYGKKLSVAVSYENRVYEFNSGSLLETEQSEEAIVKGLARQLAYMMSSDFADFPPSRWQAFKEVIEGLENYRRYLLSGRRNLSSLDAAHSHFEQATVEDSQYAWAYYNLGLLYEEQGEMDSAYEMYKQAGQTEPNLREAQFQLGKAYFQRGQLLNAINAGKRAVELAGRARRPFPVARTFLGEWLYSLSLSLLYDGQSDISDALLYCNQALEQLKIAKKEYGRLIKQERRRVNFSEQRLASLKAGAIYSLQELGRAYQILAALLEKVSPEDASQRKRRNALKKAEDALGQCLKLYPESSAVHRELSSFYMERKDYQLAQKHLENAGNISPEDKSVVLGLGATYLGPAVDKVENLIKEFQENPDGWQANWPDQRINATRSQLDLAEVHYQTVIDLTRSQGEAEGVEDQNSMIMALNGLASINGAQALIKCIQNEDCSVLIEKARQYLGKALVLNPFDFEVYDNLTGIYAIESAVQSLASEDIAVDSGEAVDTETLIVDAPPQIETTPSEIEMIGQACETLTAYVREYGENNPELITGITMALVLSTPEQRASHELVVKFLENGNVDLPSPDEIEASPVSQFYLWTVGWMFNTVGMLEWGIRYLERAQEMGWHPEVDLVDYDLGNVYLSLHKWHQAAECFQEMVPADPYYWQSRIILADTLHEIERSRGSSSALPMKSLPEVTRGSDEYPIESEGQKSESVIVEEPGGEAKTEESLFDLQPPADIAETDMPDQKRYSLPDETPDAESVYSDAITFAGIDPYRRATTLAARANLFWNLKRYVDAIRDCREAFRIVPAYAYPHRILAQIYMDLYDYDRAIAEWEHVGKLVQDMDEPQYHLGLGDAYASKAYSSSDPEIGDSWRQQAVQEYQHALQLFQSNEATDIARTQIALGAILMELKQFKEAEIAFLAALEISRGTPAEGNIRDKLAYVYIKQHLYWNGNSEYEKVISLYEEQLKNAQASGDEKSVFQISGDLANACNLKAYYVHAERNVNLDEGLKLVNRALVELERSNLDEANKQDSRGAYLDTRGWIYFRQGKYSAARQDFEKALSLTMGTVYEHGHLALTYEQLAEASQDESERKQLQTKAKEQWKFAFELDHTGVWADYRQTT